MMPVTQFILDRPEGLTATGEAVRNATPEMVEVCFEIHGGGPTASMALQDNAIRGRQVGQALLNAGVAQSDLRISPQLARPVIQPQLPGLMVGSPLLLAGFAGPGLAPTLPLTEGMQLVSYHATSSISVLIREVARLGEAIDAATRAGAVVTGGFQFQLRDEPAARDQLLEEAANQARDKADVLASALGKGLGDLSCVFEDFTVYQSQLTNGYHAPSPAMAPWIPRPPFTPGHLVLHARVRVTYKLGATKKA
jgi:uncharacterized protein YggE